MRLQRKSSSEVPPAPRVGVGPHPVLGSTLTRGDEGGAPQPRAEAEV